MAKKRRFWAVLAAVGFAALFVFQVLLAAGAPLGRAAYWGTSATLMPELRFVSAASALLCLGAFWTVLVRGGLLAAGARAARSARWMAWGYAVMFGLSTMVNLASSSPWERFCMAPLAMLLTVCCVLLAREPRDATDLGS